MPSLLRRDDVSVIQQLLDAPQRYACFQALRLLLAWLAEHGVQQDAALANIVRFDNSVSLAFPASQIEALATGGIEDAEELLQALLSGRLPQLHLTPTFMGFLGNQGVLPSHYSERIAAHQYDGHEHSARAFLDLFSSRALTLFYQAWNKYRLEHPPLRDLFLSRLLALAGCHPGVADETIGLYSGLLQQTHISSLVMQRMLADHFGVPFHIAEATGAMTPLAPREQTALGGANAVLGRRAIVGERCRRPDLAARVRIGPLTARQHAGFLPDGPAGVQLKHLLQLFGQPLLRYDIVLVLRASDVHGLTLAAAQQYGLGRNSFLGTQPAPLPRDDMHYELQLMPALND
ncbi:MAG: type VI secretion system baseplate subunit TssG [Janthinobacterium sp.]